MYNKALCDSTGGVWDYHYLAWYYTSNSILIRSILIRSNEKKVKGNQRKQYAVICMVLSRFGNKQE